jgi:2-polyprenyl-6-methoxyphenol hydroxylase-like FAD-dependent oxidoreductase
MSDFDIIIVGGGMVGQAFALSMAKSDLTIAIIEPNNPNPDIQKNFHARVSAITPASEIFLRHIEAWDLIQRKHAFTSTKVGVDEYYFGAG